MTTFNLGLVERSLLCCLRGEADLLPATRVGCSMFLVELVNTVLVRLVDTWKQETGEREEEKTRSKR